MGGWSVESVVIVKFDMLKQMGSVMLVQRPPSLIKTSLNDK